MFPSGSVEQVRAWPWSVLRRGRGRRAKCSTKLKNLTGLLEYQAAGGARTGTDEMVVDQATFVPPGDRGTKRRTSTERVLKTGCWSARVLGWGVHL